MGRPARTQLTVTARRDGSLYSSHRVRPPGAHRDDPGLPTRTALELHGKQVRRANNRRVKLARRQKGNR